MQVRMQWDFAPREAAEDKRPWPRNLSLT